MNNLRSPRSCTLWFLATLLLAGCTVAITAASATQIVAWGRPFEWQQSGQTNVPPGLINVVALAAGSAHSIALNADGTVTAWGKNSNGQTNVPPDATNVIAIAGGDVHSLALRADGTVVAWGGGTNNTGGWPEYGQSSVPEGLTNVVAIAAGKYHNVVVKSDGTLIAWGDNTFGQTNIPAGLSNVIAVAAAAFHTMVLKPDGTVTGWGKDTSGLLNIPPSATNVVAIACGPSYSLALRADGTVVAWGIAGLTPYMTTPTNVPPTVTNVLAIASGGTHWGALRQDGSLAMVGFFFHTNVPSGVLGVSSVVCGESHTMALISDAAPFVTAPPLNRTVVDGSSTFLRVAASGALPMTYQWMFNGNVLPEQTNAVLALNDVQLTNAGLYSVGVSNGIGGVETTASLGVVPLTLALKPEYVSTFRGATVTFAANAKGRDVIAYQWRFEGDDIEGATSSTLTLTNVQPEYSGLYSVFAENVAGSLVADATLVVGPIAAWGDNSRQQSTVPPDVGDVTAISGGDAHTLALRSDGTVIAWGDNTHGQSDVPVGLADVIAISAGAAHSLALQNNGTVVGWGDDAAGQATVPADLTNVVAIAAGAEYNVALINDGSLRAWGDNSYGQTNCPSNLTNVVSIGAGDFHGMAVMSDGRLVGWGLWLQGQTNASMHFLHPGNFVTIAFVTNGLSLSSGGEHNLLVRDTRIVAANGFNGFGQTATNMQWSLINTIAADAGGDFSMALNLDGTVRAWGDNTAGQTNVPVNLANVIAISAGGGHGLALVGDAPLPLQEPLFNASWDYDSGWFSFLVPARSGRVYRPEYTDELDGGIWTSLPLVSGNVTLTVTDFNPTNSPRFYRVRQW